MLQCKPCSNDVIIVIIMTGMLSVSFLYNEEHLFCKLLGGKGFWLARLNCCLNEMNRVTELAKTLTMSIFITSAMRDCVHARKFSFGWCMNMHVYPVA